jgi:predicted permease
MAVHDFADGAARAAIGLGIVLLGLFLSVWGAYLRETSRSFWIALVWSLVSAGAFGVLTLLFGHDELQPLVQAGLVTTFTAGCFCLGVLYQPTLRIRRDR